MSCLLSVVPASLIVPGVGRLTVTVCTAETPGAKFASPPYEAEIRCEPRPSDGTNSVALPLTSVAVPSVVPATVDVAPSRKVTVPVSPVAPEIAPTTLAVSTIGSPTTAETVEADSDTLAAVRVLTTTCVNAGDVLPPNVPSPPYTAWSRCARPW